MKLLRRNRAVLAASLRFYEVDIGLVSRLHSPCPAENIQLKALSLSMELWMVLLADINKGGLP